MTDKSVHSIRSQEFQVDLSTKGRSDEFFQRITGLQSSRIKAIVEAVLTQFSEEGYTLSLDEVDLDLGTISEINFENEVAWKIEEKLIDFFRRNEYPNGELKIGTRRAEPAYLADQLYFYLSNGYFNWNKGKKLSHLELMDIVLKSPPEDFREKMLILGKNDQVRKRLIQQFDDKRIELIVEKMNTEEGKNLISYKRTIEKDQSKKQYAKTSTETYRDALWDIVLHYLFLESKSYFRKKHFLSYYLTKIANRFTVSFEELLTHFKAGVNNAEGTTNDQIQFSQIIRELITERLGSNKVSGIISRQQDIDSVKLLLDSIFTTGNFPPNSSIRSYGALNALIEKEWIKHPETLAKYFSEKSISTQKLEAILPFLNPLNSLRIVETRSDAEVRARLLVYNRIEKLSEQFLTANDEISSWLKKNKGMVVLSATFRPEATRIAVFKAFILAMIRGNIIARKSISNYVTSLQEFIQDDEKRVLEEILKPRSSESEKVDSINSMEKTSSSMEVELAEESQGVKPEISIKESIDTTGNLSGFEIIESMFPAELRQLIAARLLALVANAESKDYLSKEQLSLIDDGLAKFNAEFVGLQPSEKQQLYKAVLDRVKLNFAREKDAISSAKIDESQRENQEKWIFELETDFNNWKELYQIVQPLSEASLTITEGAIVSADSRSIIAARLMELVANAENEPHLSPEQVSFIDAALKKFNAEFVGFSTLEKQRLHQAILEKVKLNFERKNDALSRSKDDGTQAEKSSADPKTQDHSDREDPVKWMAELGTDFKHWKQLKQVESESFQAASKGTDRAKSPVDLRPTIAKTLTALIAKAESESYLSPEQLSLIDAGLIKFHTEFIGLDPDEKEQLYQAILDRIKFNFARKNELLAKSDPERLQIEESTVNLADEIHPDGKTLQKWMLQLENDFTSWQRLERIDSQFSRALMKFAQESNLTLAHVQEAFVQFIKQQDQPSQVENLLLTHLVGTKTSADLVTDAVVIAAENGRNLLSYYFAHNELPKWMQDREGESLIALIKQLFNSDRRELVAKLRGAPDHSSFLDKGTFADLIHALDSTHERKFLSFIEIAEVYFENSLKNVFFLSESTIRLLRKRMLIVGIESNFQMSAQDFFERVVFISSQILKIDPIELKRVIYFQENNLETAASSFTFWNADMVDEKKMRLELAQLDLQAQEVGVFQEALISKVALNAQQQMIIAQILLQIDILKLIQLESFKQSLLDQVVRDRFIQFSTDKKLENLVQIGLTQHGKVHFEHTLKLLGIFSKSLESQKFKRIREIVFDKLIRLFSIGHLRAFGAEQWKSLISYAVFEVMGREELETIIAKKEENKSVEQQELIQVVDAVIEVVDKREEKEIMKEEQALEGAKNSEEDIIFIENAGLVILSPFIGHLLQRMQLTEDGKFIDDVARDKAINVLQHLVFGEREYGESDLVLNKVLLGVDMNLPIAVNLEITVKERETIDGLLEAVIQQWNAIKNTSIEGLRESFLMREGKLFEEETEFRLIITPRAYDMLLDQIPWNVHLVKMSWMEKPLRVEWK